MSKTTNTPKRAVSYARASRQIKDSSHCIQEQLDEIKAYAKANNIEIIGEFYDINKSANNAKRPGLQSLINFATNEQVDYVVVLQISRLSRNVPSFHADIMSKLTPKGITIKSVTEEFADTSQGRFFQLMKLAQAQYYSDLCREEYQRRNTMLKMQATD